MRRYRIAVFVSLLGVLASAAALHTGILGLRGEDNYVERTDAVSAGIEAFFAERITAAEQAAESEVLKEWLSDGGDSDELKSNCDILRQGIADCAAVDLVRSSDETAYQYLENKTVVMSPDNPRDGWYYSFISGNMDFNTELYQHTVNGRLYLYYNRKVFDQAGGFLGVAGFTFEYDDIAGLLSIFTRPGSDVFFTDGSGTIVLHRDQKMMKGVTIYDYYGIIQSSVNQNETGTQVLSMSEKGYHHDLRYISDLDLYLNARYPVSLYLKGFDLLLIPFILFLAAAAFFGTAFLRRSAKTDVSAFLLDNND